LWPPRYLPVFYHECVLPFIHICQLLTEFLVFLLFKRDVVWCYKNIANLQRVVGWSKLQFVLKDGYLFLIWIKCYFQQPGLCRLFPQTESFINCNRGPQVGLKQAFALFNIMWLSAMSHTHLHNHGIDHLCSVPELCYFIHNNQG